MIDHYDDVIIVVNVVRATSLPDADADAGLAGPAVGRGTDTGPRVDGRRQDAHQDTVDPRLQGGLVTRLPLQTLRKLGRLLRYLFIYYKDRSLIGAISARSYIATWG